MKAYGIPRWKDVEYPDKADINLYGFPSRAGKIRNRKENRRIFKKIERLHARQNIRKELESF